MKHFSELSPAAERVVDAAEGLVQRFGYTGFSYDDVASIIGIKKPSVHHHFATKAQLVAVVAQRYTHIFRGRLLAIEGLHANAPDRLLAYAYLFEKTFETSRRLCVCGMLGAEVESLPPEVTREVERFFQFNLDWLVHCFADGQRNGRVRDLQTPLEYSEAFLCILEGALVVGRGIPSAKGPLAVASTYLSGVLT